MYIREFLNQELQVEDEEIVRQVEGAAKCETLKKGEMVIEAGDRHENISFLLEGVMRGFVIDVNGRDITDCFIFGTGDAAVGCNDLNEPSHVSIEAMTDCKVLQIPTALIESLIETHPELLLIYNRLLVRALKRHWEVKMVVYRCTAMQRYQWFLKEYPELIEIVSNKHIASFLDMTPVTLSRLRRQLREKKEKQEPSSAGPSCRGKLG